jgi:hypothetical protein
MASWLGQGDELQYFASKGHGAMLSNLAYKSASLALLAALTVSYAAAEDLTIVSSVTTGKKGKTTTATQYIESDRIRTSDGVNDTIFDVASGRMIHIDHKKKEYWETSLDEMREQFAELNRMLEENPMMATMFGAATEVNVRKGSETREIVGYVCDQYSLSIGKLQYELWAARGLKAPAQYYDGAKLVYVAMGPMAGRFEQLYEEMKKIEGFPLRSELDSKLMGMNIHSVSEATEVRKGPIPPGTFDPPAGYKSKKSPYEKKPR